MQLVKWDSIKREIETAKDWDELKKVSGKIAAFRIWAKQTKQSLEVQNQIAEYRLRLERLKGKWLEENVPHGGRNQFTSGKVESLNLADLGISKYESATARQIASIPDEDFERFIQQRVSAINKNFDELTTASVIRFAKASNIKEPEKSGRSKSPSKEREIKIPSQEEQARNIAELIITSYAKKYIDMIVRILSSVE